MRKTISTIAVGIFLLSQIGLANAVDFGVGTTVPVASGASITLQKMTCDNAACSTATPSAATSLDFTPMTFDATNSVYRSDHFYQVVIVPLGVGTTNANVSYTEGTNPNPAGHGLGSHAVATFIKVGPGTTETKIAPTLTLKKTLNSIGTVGVAATTPTSTYMKVYVGLAAGGDVTEPTDAELFTALDAAGAYAGTLTVTATVS